jgi:hypothetical protein
MQSTSTPCRICGSLRRVHGRVEDASFKVKIPFARIVLSDCVTMNAVACLECGNVELQVDSDKVKSILGENPK